MESVQNYKTQKAVLRELAKQVAEISELPIQERTKKEWKALNSLNPSRPMFMIDQLPWEELHCQDELNLQCVDETLRGFEWNLRETLYRFKRMPDDRVVSKDFRVPKAIHSTGYGQSLAYDMVEVGTGAVASSRHFKNVIQDEADIDKIEFPVITEDKEKSSALFNTACDIFDGILNTVQGGCDTFGHVWDIISQYHGVEQCILDLVDRSEFMHKLTDRFFKTFHSDMDQCEKLGLIDVGQPQIHCTGAFSDELPGFNGENQNDLEKYRHSTKNVWTYGAAQLFSMVSPDMHDEFEITYQKAWYARFGLGYYGCCEPLDKKIAIINKLPNVRKISMSPWANMEIGSECMNGEYVFSRKPNPSFLACDTWDTDIVRKDLELACSIAARYNNPCELILKDVSTVRNHPQRLWEWSKIAADICGK